MGFYSKFFKKIEVKKAFFLNKKKIYKIYKSVHWTVQMWTVIDENKNDNLCSISKMPFGE